MTAFLLGDIWKFKRVAIFDYYLIYPCTITLETFIEEHKSCNLLLRKQDKLLRGEQNALRIHGD